MSRFVDKTDDEWVIDFNVGLIEDIRDATGVDFDKVLQNPEEIASFLFSEPKKLVQVLYVICEQQCKNKNVDPKQFGYRFDRQTLDKAANSLIEAIVTFYPRTSAGRVLAEELPGIIKKMDEKISEKVRKSVLEVSLNTPMN